MVDVKIEGVVVASGTLGDPTAGDYDTSGRVQGLTGASRIADATQAVNDELKVVAGDVGLANPFVPVGGTQWFDGVVAMGPVDAVTTPTARVFRASHVLVGGAGDVPGIDQVYEAGLGTGVGQPGLHVFQAALKAAAGDNAQTVLTTLEVGEILAGVQGARVTGTLLVPSGGVGILTGSIGTDHLRVGTDELVVDSVGNVGIGISTPTVDLHVDGIAHIGASDPTASTQLSVRNDVGVGIILQLKQATGAPSFLACRNASGAPVASIQADGRVDAASLVVNAAALTGVVRIEELSSVGSTEPVIVMKAGTGATKRAVIQYLSGQTTVKWQNGMASSDTGFRYDWKPVSASVMSLTQAGELVIADGMPTAAARLHVKTDDAARVGMRVDGEVTQTANLAEWRDSGAVILAAIDSSGSVSAAALAVVGNAGFFGTAPVGQPADVGALTDSTGGTTDDTVAAVSGSGADAAINDNFAELSENVNALRDTLRTLGLMA